LKLSVEQLNRFKDYISYIFVNEIFNFRQDSQYIFPDKWFGTNKPKFKIEDLIDTNNKKFKLVHIS